MAKVVGWKEVEGEGKVAKLKVGRTESLFYPEGPRDVQALWSRDDTARTMGAMMGVQ